MRSDVFQESYFIRTHQAIEILWSQLVDTFDHMTRWHPLGPEAHSSAEHLVLLEQIRSLLEVSTTNMNLLLRMPIGVFLKGFRSALGTASGA